MDGDSGGREKMRLKRVERKADVMGECFRMVVQKPSAVETY